MDKLSKLLSKALGGATEVPPPPQTQTQTQTQTQLQPQNPPSIIVQTPTANSLIPATGPSTPLATTPPGFATVSQSAQPTAQELFFNAVKNNSYDKVRQLLQAPSTTIDIAQLDPATGKSALRIALNAGNDSLAQLLVAQGEAPVNAETKGGETPLMLAASYGLIKTTKSLLRRGAQVDDQDQFGKTALQHACGNKTENVDLIQALLDAGADVNKADVNNRTPLSIACANGHLNVVKLLLEKGARVDKAEKQSGYTPLMRACTIQDDKTAAEMVKLLFDNGASPDCHGKLGDTPFTVAASFNKPLALAQLIAKVGGVPAKTAIYLDKANDKGETAWTIARQGNFTDIENLLKTHGANQKKPLH